MTPNPKILTQPLSIQTPEGAAQASVEPEGQTPTARPVDGMFTEEETMAKIRAKIGKKSERPPLGKTALQNDYARSKVNLNRHKPIKLHLVSMGEGKPGRLIAVIIHRNFKNATPPTTRAQLAFLVPSR